MPSAIFDLLRADAFDHRLGDLLVGARPDIDDLVVALARRHQTRLELLLDLDHFLLGLFQDFLLLARDHHVVDADRDARAGGETEAGVHQLVGEHDGFLQAQFSGNRR